MLESKLRRYVASLDAEIGVDRVLLFGSTAKRNRLEESDVDLIIVSKAFENMPIPQRLGIAQKEWDSLDELQALTYTPSEFESISRRTTMREILAYAVDLTPTTGSKLCPRCSKKGSLQHKVVRNRLGKPYAYYYYAHYSKGKVKWCYVGKTPQPTERLPHTIAKQHTC